MNAVGAKTSSQRAVRADQKQHSSPARLAAQGAAQRRCIRRAKSSEDHPGPARQAGNHPRRARRAIKVGEEEQGRRGLSQARASP